MLQLAVSCNGRSSPFSGAFLMDFVQPDSTFIIPLLRPNSAPGALSDFVGDENNKTLRYLITSQSLKTSDWPLILYGSTGTGKTELAHSIIKLDPFSVASKPIYQSAIEFSRFFNSAVDTDSTEGFRKRYIKSGGLVVDDIHNFSRFPAAQQEMVYLLDQLALIGTPIIMTANQPVQMIEALIPQLASRLLNGLCINLKPPGIEARRVIVNRLANVFDIEMDLESVDLLVKRLPVTVPKIRQFYVQFLAQRDSSFSGPVTRNELSIYFDELNSKDQERLANLIIQSVAREFKLSPTDITGSSRKQTTALARSISIYLHRSLLLMSFSKIGSYYGGRDHSTIMHAYKKILDVLNDDQKDNASRARTLKLESQLNEVLAVNI